MSGQSANLSLKEARMLQCKIQASGSHAHTNGGGSYNKPGKMKHEQMKKEK